MRKYFEKQQEVQRNKNVIKKTAQLKNDLNPGFKFDVIALHLPFLAQFPYKFIVIDKSKNDILGKGAFGKVRKAYLLDEQTMTFEKEPFYAIKIIHSQKDYTDTEFLHEIKIQHQINFYKFAAAKIENDYIILQENLGENFKVAHANNVFAQLTFLQRVEIAVNASIILHLMHHNTPASGQTLIHKDIKPGNCMLLKKKLGNSQQQFTVNFIDFDFAESADSDPNITRDVNQASGTMAFAPIEIFYSEFIGVKSDIFPFLSVLKTIFGGQPFHGKREAYIDKLRQYAPHNYPYILILKELINSPIDLSDVLSGIIDVPKCDVNISELLIKFLSRMNSRYHERPDSDELLIFFTTLYNLCLVINDNTLEEEDKSARKKEYSTKLLELSNPAKDNTLTQFLTQSNLWLKELRLLNNTNSTLLKKSDSELHEALFNLFIQNILTKRILRYVFDCAPNELEYRTQMCRLFAFAKNNININLLLTSMGENPLDVLMSLSCDSQKLSETFGHPYLETLQQKMIKSEFKNILSYAKQKKADIIKNQDHGVYTGWKFFPDSLSFNAGQKRDAAVLLINAYTKQDGVNLFFSKENKILRRALRQGALGNLAKEKIAYLEEHRKSASRS